MDLRYQNIVTVLKGSIHSDLRGSLKYFNDLDLSPVKRFYISQHADLGVVKAWQGHQRERKWFYVSSGTFKIVLVQPDYWDSPSSELGYKEFIMHSEDNQVLCIPGGYATGFEALKPDSSLMIFSDFTLEQSMEDDFRFDKNMWYKW